jgi:hypothetical protein
MHGPAAVPIIVSVKSFSAYQVIVGSEEGLPGFNCGILAQKKKKIYDFDCKGCNSTKL